MKALTLYPTWAVLIALEAKRLETRSWESSYRGPLAITASARITDDDRACFDQEPYVRVLRAAGFLRVQDLPRGCVVCTGLLTNIFPAMDVAGALSEQERAFGFYDHGRFAWEIEGVERLQPPLPCKGNQGLWELDLAAARESAAQRASSEEKLLL